MIEAAHALLLSPSSRIDPFEALTAFPPHLSLKHLQPNVALLLREAHEHRRQSQARAVSSMWDVLG